MTRAIMRLVSRMSVLLPLRIGQARSEDLLYSGRSIDAQTALAWGLANAVSEGPSAAALDYFERHLATKSAASLALAVRAAREPFAELARARLAGEMRQRQRPPGGKHRQRDHDGDHPRHRPAQPGRGQQLGGARPTKIAGGAAQSARKSEARVHARAGAAAEVVSRRGG